MAFGARTPDDNDAQTPPDDHANPDLDGSKFHHARILTAALAYLLLNQGDSVGLVLASNQIVRQVAPRAAPGHVLSLCQALLDTPPAGQTHIARVLAQLAARLNRRSLIVVASDLLDDPRQTLSALGQLAHRGHEVIVFHVLHRREVEFDLGLAGHGVTILKDMETADEFPAEPQLIRDLVRGEIRRFCDQLDAGTRAHGIHLLRCLTDEPPASAVIRFVRSRGRRGGRSGS
jgi:uncharacterized protein (DUF58 family)